MRAAIQEDPFATDEELAQRFKVSVQTVRLDRLELGIPELRQRMQDVARQVYSKVRSVSTGEVIGELVDVELGRTGLSILDTHEGMGFQRTRIIRGHYIFAQANSLAVAIVDAPVALTGSAEVRFVRPVFVGERIVAKASVSKTEGRRFSVDVSSRVNDEEVFRGKFAVFALDEDELVMRKDGDKNRG